MALKKLRPKFYPDGCVLEESFYSRGRVGNVDDDSAERERDSKRMS